MDTTTSNEAPEIDHLALIEAQQAERRATKSSAVTPGAPPYLQMVERSIAMTRDLLGGDPIAVATKEEAAQLPPGAVAVRGGTLLHDAQIFAADAELARVAGGAYSELRRKMGIAGAHVVVLVDYPALTTRPPANLESVPGGHWLTIASAWMALDADAARTWTVAREEFQRRERTIEKEAIEEHERYVARMAELAKQSEEQARHAQRKARWRLIDPNVRAAISAASRYPAGSVERRCLLALAESYERNGDHGLAFDPELEQLFLTYTTRAHDAARDGR
jgi:hypothetical protein